MLRVEGEGQEKTNDYVVVPHFQVVIMQRNSKP